MMTRGTFSTRRLVQKAFTLIEILVVVTLLSVIILGLVAMFHQTQKAFKAGMMQVDVLEAGRMATDFIARDLEQMTPSYHHQAHPNSTNFFVMDIEAWRTPITYVPLVQSLPPVGPPPAQRTNILDDLFFIKRQNQTWTGVGYYVRTDDGFHAPWGPVGTLYRFETNNTPAQFQTSNSLAFFRVFFNSTNPPNRVSKILDGVVHFHIRAYDTDGVWINPNSTNMQANTAWTPNTYLSPDMNSRWKANYIFRSNALPAYVEFEIGILEPAVLGRYQSLPTAASRREYLEKQAGRVHLFRQRIPIRNLDVTAYQ